MTKYFEGLNHEIHIILNVIAYADKEKREIVLCVGICLHWILDYAKK